MAVERRDRRAPRPLVGIIPSVTLGVDPHTTVRFQSCRDHEPLKGAGPLLAKVSDPPLTKGPKFPLARGPGPPITKGPGSPPAEAPTPTR